MPHQSKSFYWMKRAELAKQFREKYSSNNEEGEANKLPYFFGAFDTVASLADPVVLGILLASAAAIVVIFSWILSFWALSFKSWLGLLILLSVIGCAVAYVETHLKAFGLGPRRWGSKLHLTEPKMKFHVIDSGSWRS
jgi:hypothetical protein